MKILVTGAAGFIGGQLWHTLWKRGDEVVGIDNFSYGNPDNLKFDDHDFGAEVRRMDIRDKAGMLALFEAEKFDVVYNIAGIAPLPDCQSDPVQAIEVNTCLLYTSADGYGSPGTPTPYRCRGGSRIRPRRSVLS